MSGTMKNTAHDENEIHDVTNHKDPAQNVITPVLQMHPNTMNEMVTAIKDMVRRAHKNPNFLSPDVDGIIRAQVFEEGDVFMLERPFEDFASDRYWMDFYDVTAPDRQFCSRMHIHTGLRFVRMMTGDETEIRVSSLSQFKIAAVGDFSLEQTIDEMPDEVEIKRYTVIVPANSMVDMQIPAGVSHQFNAVGKNAVIDSVHPEERIEMFRENMQTPNMMAQTIFLGEHHPDLVKCGVASAALEYASNVIEGQFTKVVVEPARGERKWTAMAVAASIAAVAALPAIFGGVKSFQEANFVKNSTTPVMQVEFNNGNYVDMVGAYGASETAPVERILLPKTLYALIQAKPALASDMEYVAWVAGKTELRKVDGVVDANQTIFSYHITTADARFKEVIVTPENYNDAIKGLKVGLTNKHQTLALNTPPNPIYR